MSQTQSLLVLGILRKTSKEVRLLLYIGKRSCGLVMTYMSGWVRHGIDMDLVTPVHGRIGKKTTIAESHYLLKQLVRDMLRILLKYQQST
jgi:hypothetical protein